MGDEPFALVHTEDHIATITLTRGKVNALTLAVVEQLHAAFESLESDDDVRAIVFTGQGSFFSFGFDIPAMYAQSRDEFSRFVHAFTQLYRYLFTYPKPVVAALNGHTIAGGCMLALACDRRIMVTGRPRISLNEITFGATVFAGSVEMLRAAAGTRNAARVLQSGAMFGATEAEALGLVDSAVDPTGFEEAVQSAAKALAGMSPPAFRSVKLLLRQPIVQQFAEREATSISEFLDVWYSPATREALRGITIRE